MTLETDKNMVFRNTGYNIINCNSADLKYMLELGLVNFVEILFYPHPLQYCGSTDGHFLLLHTSNFLFLLSTVNSVGVWFLRCDAILFNQRESNCPLCLVVLCECNFYCFCDL